MREHFRQEYGNLTLHFVEESLPANVYLVLSDKAIEITAAYESIGDRTAMTKVGIKVADKKVIISKSKLTIDGTETKLKDFEHIGLEHGYIKGERGKLIISHGAYTVFVKVPCPKRDDSHVGFVVGVEENAKVTPTGFIGARISVDPRKYTTFETIA